MKYRSIAALSAVLAMSFGVATASTAMAAGNTLTVWLQVDAQNGWPNLVANANSAFRPDHPGWTVNVDYQQWSDHLTKFDATIAGNDTPDVIEMGNTEMTKYMAEGAFANLGSVQGVVRELQPLAAGPQRVRDLQQEALYGVPYYAGSRVITYRSDLFTKARHQEAPDEPFAVRGRHGEDRDDGEEGQGLLTAVCRRRGLVHGAQLRVRLRRPDRQLQRASGSARSTRRSRSPGLTAFQQFFNATQSKSTAKLDGRTRSRTRCSRRARRPPTTGRPGTPAAPGARTTCTVTKQFVMPSHTKGQPMPGFLGGSDLAVPASELEPGSGRSVDRRLHEHGEREGSGRRRATSPTRPTCSATASTTGLPRAAGSFRRPRTGSTSRMGTSSRRCSARSSPGSSRSSRLRPWPVTTSRRLSTSQV